MDLRGQTREVKTPPPPPPRTPPPLPTAYGPGMVLLHGLSITPHDLTFFWGEGRGSVSGRALDFRLIGVSTCGFESYQGPFRSLTFPPVLRDWVIKGFGMSSLVYATGHIKDPVPLIEKRRGLSPGGRFPPSFVHQVIIITGLNKLQLYVLALKMALDADRA